MACSQDRFSLGRELHVGLGPLARPVVLVAVEGGAAEPVLPGQVGAVAHAHPALLGRVDQEEPAERPERLPAEALLGLLVEQEHLSSGVGQFGCRGQAGKARAHDDHICVHAPTLGMIMPTWWSLGADFLR
nr:hypothetical protein GCM10020092_047910 [Actinoplanes digitatis]